MRILSHGFALLFLAGIHAELPSVHAQVVKGKRLVEANLLASETAIVPGQPLVIGLQLKMAPGWHTYWLNPGDSGLPTSISWDLPPGFTASPIEWPTPKKIVAEGLVSYAYEDTVMLLVTITPPAEIAEKSITLKGRASWLVCEAICIPGNASLTLTLPVEPSANLDNVEIFETAKRALPVPLPDDVQVARSIEGSALTMTLKPLPEDWGQFTFFPLPAQGQLAEVMESGSEDGMLSIKVVFQTKPELASQFSGLLSVVNNAGQTIGYQIAPANAPPATAAETPDAVVAPIPPAPTAETPGTSVPPPQSGGLAALLLFAFLGGLILNAMPCVLPVLSLKIYHFINQAGEDRRKIFKMGIAFSAGIFAWFMGIGVVSAWLKAAGQDVFWGTIFQNSQFVFVLALFAFAFALNLLGVFEIVLPGRVTTKIAGATKGGGYASAFSNGFFVTILGSACTAPFLGSAIGTAFTQSPPVILTVFAAISLGMSAPYLILTAQPGWMKFLPKPGAWMETFKQAMGFILMPVVVWLLYVVGKQRGVDALIWSGMALVGVSFLLWTWGRLQHTRGGKFSRWFGGSVAVALAIWTCLLGWNAVSAGSAQSRPAADATLPDVIYKDADKMPWVEFSPSILEAALATDRIVFLDFTADWCFSCKVNERTVLNTLPIVKAFRDAGVIPIKVDWTNNDPEIAERIKSFGRAGVPVYVFYAVDRTRAPLVLPEFLTHQIVLDALKTVGGTNGFRPLANRPTASEAVEP